MRRPCATRRGGRSSARSEAPGLAGRYRSSSSSTVNSHYLRLLALGAPISGQNNNLNLLVYGADQVADVLGAVRGQLGQTLGTVSGLVQALTVMQSLERAFADFGGVPMEMLFDQLCQATSGNDPFATLGIDPLR